jgi:hypothetical protein
MMRPSSGRRGASVTSLASKRNNHGSTAVASSLQRIGGYAAGARTLIPSSTINNANISQSRSSAGVGTVTVGDNSTGGRIHPRPITTGERTALRDAANIAWDHATSGSIPASTSTPSIVAPSSTPAVVASTAPAKAATTIPAPTSTVDTSSVNYKPPTPIPSQPSLTVSRDNNAAVATSIPSNESGSMNSTVRSATVAAAVVSVSSSIDRGPVEPYRAHSSGGSISKPSPLSSSSSGSRRLRARSNSLPRRSPSFEDSISLMNGPPSSNTSRATTPTHDNVDRRSSFGTPSSIGSHISRHRRGSGGSGSNGSGRFWSPTIASQRRVTETLLASSPATTPGGSIVRSSRRSLSSLDRSTERLFRRRSGSLSSNSSTDDITLGLPPSLTASAGGRSMSPSAFASLQSPLNGTTIAGAGAHRLSASIPQLLSLAQDNRELNARLETIDAEFKSLHRMLGTQPAPVPLSHYLVPSLTTPSSASLSASTLTSAVAPTNGRSFTFDFPPSMSAASSSTQPSSHPSFGASTAISTSTATSSTPAAVTTPAPTAPLPLAPLSIPTPSPTPPPPTEIISPPSSSSVAPPPPPPPPAVPSTASVSVSVPYLFNLATPASQGGRPLSFDLTSLPGGGRSFGLTPSASLGSLSSHRRGRSSMGSIPAGSMLRAPSPAADISTLDAYLDQVHADFLLESTRREDAKRAKIESVHKRAAGMHDIIHPFIIHHNLLTCPIWDRIYSSV